MPHIIIEYSQESLSRKLVKFLLSEAFYAVKSTRLFDEQNIKVRAHPVEHYQLGESDSGFMHIICRIHTGKTQDEKQLLTQTLLKSVKGVMMSSMVITVEVVEMDDSSYAKTVLKV
ncbi:5-carboxymethyl-2-hydroxymuconate Delta-isomerase [Thiomicrorhabdus chilensis]|uniref:5-carboxymethyl-2-hydroxymuconate Delta-isomerase n=1 Tax=Thiomicrorhabdus chilensis TaxID=63656 RepID=UPI00041D4C9E|nr:hypothetical protein [Thiomicrorhabdus chilensis]